MSLPSGFKPGDFMYLNPEIVVTAGLSNVWLARNWASSNIASLSNYDLSVIPDKFDANVFISGGGGAGGLDVSALNKSIYNAMLVEGLDPISRASVPVTINQSLIYLGNGVFDGAASVPSNLMSVGDIVKVRGTTTVLGSVVAIIGNQVTLSNVRNTRFGAVGSKYVLVGIEVYDVQRLGVINYVRRYGETSPIINYYQDTKFNPDLYKLLYSDSRNLSDRDAYLQYMALGSNNIRRIAKADDIVASNQNISQVQNISVAQELNLAAPSGSLRFKNTTVYGISQDDISSSQLLFPSQSYPRLVTEYAIKSYIDRPYATTATFSNAIFNGLASFNGRASFPGKTMFDNLETNNIQVNTALSNLGVGIHYGTNWFYASSNYFSSNLTIGGIVAASNVYAEKAALGALQVTGALSVAGEVTAPTVRGSNISASNLSVREGTVLDGVAYIRKIAIM